MNIILILLYAITLVYFVLSERVSKFIVLLAIQGILLFALAFNNLIHIQIIELILILLETIVVKTVAIPLFLGKVRRANKLKRVHESVIPVFYSLIIMVLILLSGFFISNSLQCENIHVQFFSIAISSVLGGIYFIIIHKNIFSHLVGYLILENGIFLFSLAVGSEMPVMVSLAVLLDIFIGILAIGIFINQIGNTFQSTNIDTLSHLKD